MRISTDKGIRRGISLGQRKKNAQCCRRPRKENLLLGLV